MELNKILNLSDKATEVEIATAVQAVITERDNLKNENTSLTDRATKAEQKVQDFEKAAKDAKDAEARNLVDVAIAEGRITAESRQAYLNLFAQDHQSAKTALQAIPAPRSAKQTIGAGQSSLTAQEKCAKLTWDELDKQDLLATLKASDPTLYAQKFEEKFNRTPSTQ